jgi:Fic family protein
MRLRVLTEPSLTVSPWFEARRAEYYDALAGVSASGDWDTWVRFFARGLAASATSTGRQLEALLDVQNELRHQVRASRLRADTALLLVDFALEQPVFSVKQVQRQLAVGYNRANRLVKDLVEVGVLQQYGEARYERKFVAPTALSVLLRGG